MRHKLALVDSIIGSRRGLLHALGALAERNEYALALLIRARLRASWWHLPQCLWRPVLALWCVYQSACKVASYLLGAIPRFQRERWQAREWSEKTRASGAKGSLLKRIQVGWVRPEMRGRIR